MGPVAPRAADSDASKDPLAGAVLAASSVFSVVLMAHHPSVAVQDTSAALADIARKAALTKGVHGGLLALMVAQAFALGELSTRLGWRRRVVRVAALAYGSGFLAMTGAALISGFVVPSIALRFDGAHEPSLDALRYVLAACVAGNRTLASFGAIGMSLAIGLWSWALRERRGALRALAGLGVVVGIVPSVAILAGALRLEVAGMTLVVIGQTLWNVGLGAAMTRGKV